MWERNINQLPHVCALIGDQTHNPGTRPDWEGDLLFCGTMPNQPSHTDQGSMLALCDQFCFILSDHNFFI